MTVKISYSPIHTLSLERDKRELKAPAPLSRGADGRLKRQGYSCPLPLPGGQDGKRKVLIVEDDLALRPFWDSILKERWPQLSVQWVLSAETAMELLDPDSELPPFDIIVVDVFLSGSLTGLDILERVEKSKWIKRCEVILSSMCDPAHLRQSLSPALNGAKILAKPYDVRQCISAIMGALSRIRLYPHHQQQGALACTLKAEPNPS